MLKKVLIGMAILFVALFAGLFAIVWKITGAPVQTIEAQLQAINQDDYPRAYGYLSRTLKAKETPEQFRAFVEQYAVLKTSGHSFGKRSINNGVATVYGTLKGRNGEMATVRYTLVKENDQWVIQSIQLGASEDD